MIASISGIVKAVRLNSIVVEVGGVGLVVHVSPRLAASYVVGTMASLHTSMAVREDSLMLYGFETSAARDLFDILQTVTGIGPKVAQSALSVYDAAELVAAIKSESAAQLERIPGLGKKGAQRLVLELKDKVGDFTAQAQSGVGNWRGQLTEALLGLGFTARDTESRLEFVAAEFKNISAEPIESLLRFALAAGGRG